MRATKIRWKRAERPNWALPFFAGLLAGIVLVYFNTEVFLSESGFLSRVSLERLGRVDVNESIFFLYVLRKRIGMLWLAAILSTTFAGIVTTYLFVLWAGVCGGVVAAVSVMRYGIKGFLLLAGGMMPHFLLYIPAFLLVADWCFQICTRLYYPVRDYTEVHTGSVSQRAGILGNFLLFHGVVIIGAIFESYVNPVLMSEILRLF